MTDDYQSKTDEIRNLATMPQDQLVNHLSSLHNTLGDSVPNIAPQIHTTAANAIAYLNQKIPVVGNDMIQDKEMKPSKSQQKSWLDLHSVVNDPASILEKANKGTLTSEDVDAVKSVYPDLHQEITQKIIEKLGDYKSKDKSLPYGKRIALAKIVGAPLDSAMSFQSMQAIINSSQNDVEASAPQQEKSSKPSQAVLGQINKVNQQVQTQTQSLSARKVLGK